MEKMSLMCTQAELPGTSFTPQSAIGHRQGIQEEFPNLRNFPPLNVVFYADADHVILEVLERWMTYINPVFDSGIREENAFTRFNYPEEYKEKLHITKFERDTFIRESRNATYQSNLTSYEFINVWPIDLTSMRVAYGDSNVLRCSVQFAYDRFIHAFNYDDVRKQVVNTPSGIVNKKTFPDGSFGIGSKSTDDFSREDKYQSSDFQNAPRYQKNRIRNRRSK